MMFDYHGDKNSFERLKMGYPAFGRGGTLRDLITIAQANDMGPRALKVDLESISKLKLPCIIHWNFNHFVILESVDRSYFAVVDPAAGRKRISKDEFSRQYTGIAVELVPLPSFPRRQFSTAASFKNDIFLYTAGFHKTILAFCLISIIVMSFSLIAPLSIQLIVDRVIPGKDQDLLLIIAIGFFLVQIISAVSVYAQQMFILRLSSRTRLSVTYEFILRTLKNNAAFFSKRDLGYFVAQFNSLHYLINHVVRDVGSSIADFFFLLLVSAILLILDYRIALIIITANLVVLAARWLTMERARNFQNNQIMSTSNEESYYVETLRGIHSVKANRMESVRIAGAAERGVLAIRDAYSARKYEHVFDLVTQIVKAGEMIITIYLLATRVLDGVMTIGAMYTFYMY
jgi:ATP-binding cassette, subfamily B, bacterial CvaB/MchF/RaxB